MSPRRSRSRTTTSCPLRTASSVHHRWKLVGPNATDGLPVTVLGVNTMLTYMYRDGSNYKNYATVVFPGQVSLELRDALTAALEGGDRFLPAQVVLTTLQQEHLSHYDDDHVWHEILTLEDTCAGPTAEPDAASFVALFTGITWDVKQAEDALEHWKRTTPRGPLDQS